MKKMRITSLLLALCMGVAMLSGCNAPVAEPEVEVIPVELSVSTADLELLVGESANIEYAVNPEDTAVTITCDNNEVAIVDASGKVVALAEGSATITVKVDEEVQETLTVKVSEPIVEIPDPVITLTERDVIKDVGDSFRLEYSLKNAEGMEVSFESENPEIAAVDDEGNVKVMGSGETAITITVGDISAAVVVTAKAKVEEVAAVSSAAPPAPASSSAASSKLAAPASSSASSSESASSAPATSGGASKNANATKFFAKSTMTISDWTTPATSFGQYVDSSRKSNAAFMDKNGNPLAILTVVNFDYDGSGYPFTSQGNLDAFNDYRGVARASVATNIPSPSTPAPSGGSSSSQSSTIDTAAYAREIIRLTNEARVAAGLHEYAVDDYAMSLAKTRAEELSIDYSHQRPGGGWAANEGWSENMARGQASPQRAFDAWMASEGHKAAILSPNFVSVGAGCYYNGTMHWILLFSFE